MKNAVGISVKTLFLLLLIPFEITAQLCVLKGRIFNAEDRTGVRLATIQLLDEQGAMITSISSGFNGFYETDSLELGGYYLQIAADGFEPIKMQPIRLMGRKSQIDIALVVLEKQVEEGKKEKKKNPFTGILGGVIKSYVSGGF